MKSTRSHARPTGDPGGVSLYLHGRSWPAVVVLCALLSSGGEAHSQELTFRDMRDLFAGGLEAFIERLEASRPAPVSTEGMAAIMKALPPTGEAVGLGPLAQLNVKAARQLLAATRRDWYEIKVVDIPQAAIALHARAVVLISAPAASLLSATELQALVAHEIGHEYIWIDWQAARERGEKKRLKELELVCDAIAAVTLHQLGLDASTLTDGLEKVTRFNRQRFGSATNEMSYPTLDERRTVVRQVQAALRASSRRSRPTDPRRTR